MREVQRDQLDWCALLLNRIPEAEDRSTRLNQRGFRGGRNWLDQIFTLHRILVHLYSFQWPTVVSSISGDPLIRYLANSIRRDVWSAFMAFEMILPVHQDKSTAKNLWISYLTMDLDRPALCCCCVTTTVFNLIRRWTSLVRSSPMVVSCYPVKLQPIIDRFDFFMESIGLAVNPTKTNAFTSNPDSTI